MGTAFSILLLLMGGLFIFMGVTGNESFFSIIRRTRRLYGSFSEESLPTAVLVSGIIFAAIGLLTLIF